VNSLRLFTSGVCKRASTLGLKFRLSHQKPVNTPIKSRRTGKERERKEKKKKKRKGNKKGREKKKE
jgi:hypothetical protein